MGTDFSLLFGGPLRPISAAAPFVPKAWSGMAPKPMTLVSWNLLAPPYKRSRKETDWRGRAEGQISWFAEQSPDVIGLQEFWLDPDHVSMWQGFAREKGYVMHVVPRVDGKQDGCALLIRHPPAACSFSAYHYEDWGSRILQVVELSVGDNAPPLVLMNTHLTFPHQSAHDPPMRRQQGRKLSELVRATAGPVCVFGDLNGDETDPAVTTLLTLGGLSPMPTASGREKGWISHVAHNGAHMACDMVLTRGCHVSAWSLGMLPALEPWPLGHCTICVSVAGHQPKGLALSDPDPDPDPDSDPDPDPDP